MAVMTKPAIDTNHCAYCSGKLANFAGSRQNSEGAYLDQGGYPVNLAPGQAPPRVYWIACSLCEAPVAKDHPLQMELDRDCAAAEAKAKAERERAALAPPASSQTAGLVYGDSAAQASQEYLALRSEVAALREELAALKSRKR